MLICNCANVAMSEIGLFWKEYKEPVLNGSWVFYEPETASLDAATCHIVAGFDDDDGRTELFNRLCGYEY